MCEYKGGKPACVMKVTVVGSLTGAQSAGQYPSGARSACEHTCWDPKLGLGVDYIPAKADITSGNFTKSDTTADTDTRVSTTSSLTAEFKDHYTIYVQPTFVINKDSAFYGKIGYSQAKVTLPATIVGSTNGAGANVTETITNRSPDMKGMQYGLGLKTFLTNQAYVSIEASYTDYDTISTTTTGGDTTKTYRADLEAVQGRVTIGYQF